MEPQESGLEPGGQIAIFPLPGTVFYPHTLLPLHIFEPRYREMVADALEGDKRIGMVQLGPGWEDDYYGNPEIVTVGCVGKIDGHVRLPDGKYNMVLKGLSRFRIIREVPGKSYRRAEIELLPEINDRDISSGAIEEKTKLVGQCREYINLLPEDHKIRKNFELAASPTLGRMTDQIAYQLDLSSEQKQTFLEEQDVLKRTNLLHSIIKMKINLIQLSKAHNKHGMDVRWN